MAVKHGSPRIKDHVGSLVRAFGIDCIAVLRIIQTPAVLTGKCLELKLVVALAKIPNLTCVASPLHAPSCSNVSQCRATLYFGAEGLMIRFRQADDHQVRISAR